MIYLVIRVVVNRFKREEVVICGYYTYVYWIISFFNMCLSSAIVLLKYGSLNIMDQREFMIELISDALKVHFVSAFGVMVVNKLFIDALDQEDFEFYFSPYSRAASIEITHFYSSQNASPTTS
jgi:hypothetical protein